MQKQTKSSQETNVVIQLLSHVLLFVTPWTVACQAPLPSTISCSLLKLISIESVMPSNHLILCCPLSSSINLSPSFCLRDIHNNLTYFFELFCRKNKTPPQVKDGGCTDPGLVGTRRLIIEMPGCSGVEECVQGCQTSSLAAGPGAGGALGPPHWAGHLTLPIGIFMALVP